MHVDTSEAPPSWRHKNARACCVEKPVPRRQQDRQVWRILGCQSREVASECCCYHLPSHATWWRLIRVGGLGLAFENVLQDLVGG